MKTKFLILAAFILSLSFQSCEDLLGIPITFNVVENLTINPFNQGNHVIEEIVQLDAETHVQSVGAELEDIKSIKINTVSVSIQSGATGDFTPFERIKLTLAADGLPEQLIAEKEILTEGATLLHFDIEDVELVDYLKLDEVTVRFEVDTNADVVDPLDIKLDINSTIQVDISE